MIRKLTGVEGEDEQGSLDYPNVIWKFEGTPHAIHNKIIEMSHNSLSSNLSVYLETPIMQLYNVTS